MKMCGFVHSTFVTLPVSVIGFDASYSAANEWCARAGSAAASAVRESRAIWIGIFTWGRPRFRGRRSGLLLRRWRERARALRELLVLEADLVDELRVHDDPLLERDGPRLRVRVRVVDADFDYEVAEVRAPD